MNSDLVWPSIVGSARRDDGSTLGDFEVEAIRRQWKEEEKRIFCVDESDMLVEYGVISEKGGLEFHLRRVLRGPLLTRVG
jgi:hypothetical protein